jgi:glyoxylate utilization-related uncharacterized protein
MTHTWYAVQDGRYLLMIAYCQVALESYSPSDCYMIVVIS